MRSKKYYYCAKKILDLVIPFASKNKIRVDTIIWDSGTKYTQKDGSTIFQLMYYQLFKNVLRKRWQAKSWKPFPDEQSNIKWHEIKEFLDLASLDTDIVTKEEKTLFQLTKKFNIVKIEEINSKKEELSQIPDLFAGLAAYSRLQYPTYLKRHGTLFGKVKLTGSERCRFKLLEYFNDCCKKHKLGVSLKSSEGLWTPNPKNPINFWTFKAQSSNEKTKQVLLSNFKEGG